MSHCSACRELFAQPTRSRHCNGESCPLGQAWQQLEVCHKDTLRGQIAASAHQARKPYTFRSIVTTAQELLHEQLHRRRSEEFAPATAMSKHKTSQTAEGKTAVGSLHFVAGVWVWQKTLKHTADVHILQRECDILRQAAMLGVVPVVHALHVGTRTLVMEYVSSLRLKALVDCTHALQLERRTVAVSLLKAVQAIHSLGISHNDLHDRNIMLRPHVWAVVLVDFGHAACVEAVSSAVQSAQCTNKAHDYNLVLEAMRDLKVPIRQVRDDDDCTCACADLALTDCEVGLLQVSDPPMVALQRAKPCRRFTK